MQSSILIRSSRSHPFCSSKAALSISSESSGSCYTHNKRTTIWIVLSFKNRQRPTFPGSVPPSIISAKELNYCVRDGNRCDLLAIVTGFSYWRFAPSKLNNVTLLAWNHWSSVRPISIGQLNVLLHLHLRPINVIVSHGSYLTGEI